MRRLLEMRADFSIYVHMDRGEIIIYQTADGETRLDVRKEIRRPRRQNGQAGARPCKMTVGDAGIKHRKPLQNVDIH